MKISELNIPMGLALVLALFLSSVGVYSAMEYAGIVRFLFQTENADWFMIPALFMLGAAFLLRSFQKSSEFLKIARSARGMIYVPPSPFNLWFGYTVVIGIAAPMIMLVNYTGMSWWYQAPLDFVVVIISFFCYAFLSLFMKSACDSGLARLIYQILFKCEKENDRVFLSKLHSS